MIVGKWMNAQIALAFQLPSELLQNRNIPFIRRLKSVEICWISLDYVNYCEQFFLDVCSHCTCWFRLLILFSLYFTAALWWIKRDGFIETDAKRRTLHIHQSKTNHRYGVNEVKLWDRNTLSDLFSSHTGCADMYKVTGSSDE